MSEARKIAAILVSDVVGYSRLAGADEDLVLARLRALRSDLIDPTISVHHGRVVKRTGDGSLVEFRSVVEAVRCGMEIQSAMRERNAGVPQERRIEFRIGIHLGDVVEESDGDLMGNGVNIAARLESIAKPGTICLSDDAYRQVRSRIDLSFTDLGEMRLKNIASPVRVYMLNVDAAMQAKPRKEPRSPTSAVFFVGMLTLMGVVIAILYMNDASRRFRAEAARLSIVVLPFSNLSNDPSQDYFASGITENLTTDLSRIRNSFVIAHNTALSFQGKLINEKEIGKELGVRYVLEGSVQRDQNRVRVNAQLIDAETGAHLWAERFEEDVIDLFKLQDGIVARLANSLGYQLVRTEARKGAHSTNPDAVDFALRGWALIWEGQQQQPSKESNVEARRFFDKALSLDPDETDALSGSAFTYMLEHSQGWTTTETDYDTKVLSQVDRAIALAPDNVWAYDVKSLYLTGTSRAQGGFSAADAGLALNPNDPPLLRARAVARNALGQYKEAIADVKEAIRISPRDPRIGLWLVTSGDAELGLQNFDAAIREYNHAIDAGWNTYQPYRGLTAAYALESNMDAAKTALAEARRRNPKFTIKWLTEHVGQTMFLEGLRKAGLQEE